jgi:hypothetical protein
MSDSSTLSSEINELRKRLQSLKKLAGEADNQQNGRNISLEKFDLLWDVELMAEKASQVILRR